MSRMYVDIETGRFGGFKPTEMWLIVAHTSKGREEVFKPKTDGDFTGLEQRIIEHLNANLPKSPTF